MTFIDWTQYKDLLEKLAEQRGSWEGAERFVSFDEALKLYCPAVRGGEAPDDDPLGYKKLVAALRGDFMNDDELVYAQIRLVALAVPAAEKGYQGAEWSRRYVSSWPGGAPYYCEDGPQAELSRWVKVEAAAPAPAQEAPGLSYDEETGLWYDASYWYLKDGKTVVEEVPGTDLFAGKDGTRYRRGVAVLWYDQETRLLYDDTSWYLEDGKTVVEEVPGTDLFVGKDGTRYRRGAAVLWYDPDTRLLYDDTSWYLEDGKTVVEEVPGTDLFADKDGRRYRLGELIREAAPPPAEAPAEPDPAKAEAEEAFVAGLAAVRQQKVAEMLARLEEAGWTPAATEQEAAERRADGEQSAMTREQLIELLDSRVEQLLSA